MEVHPESRHIVVIRKGQFCEWLDQIMNRAYKRLV
jgi:hypothetical protein